MLIITGEAVSVERAIEEAMETDILQAPVVVTMAQRVHAERVEDNERFDERLELHVWIACFIV